MAVSEYERTNSSNRSVDDQITSARMQDFNQDLDGLFARLDDRDLTFTRDTQDRVEQIVDNTNSITVNIDWSEWDDDPPMLYIREAGDPKHFVITYSALGYPESCEYVTV